MCGYWFFYCYESLIFVVVWFGLVWFLRIVARTFLIRDVSLSRRWARTTRMRIGTGNWFTTRSGSIESFVCFFFFPNSKATENEVKLTRKSVRSVSSSSSSSASISERNFAHSFDAATTTTITERIRTRAVPNQSNNRNNYREPTELVSAAAFNTIRFIFQ